MAATHSAGTDHVTTEAPPPAHDASDSSPQGQGRQGMTGRQGHGMTGGRHGVQAQGRRGIWMPRTTQYHPPQEEALPQEEPAAAAAGRLHPAAGLAPGLHPAAGLAQVDVTVDIPGSLQLAASLVYAAYVT